MTQRLTRIDWLLTAGIIAVFTVLIAVSAFVLLPNLWYVWGLLVGGALVVLVWWHTHRFSYRCPNCKHEFDISIVTNLTRPHGIARGGAWKYLRCPSCGDRVKAAVRRSSPDSNQGDPES